MYRAIHLEIPAHSRGDDSRFRAVLTSVSPESAQNDVTDLLKVRDRHVYSLVTKDNGAHRELRAVRSRAGLPS